MSYEESIIELMNHVHIQGTNSELINREYRKWVETNHTHLFKMFDIFYYHLKEHMTIESNLETFNSFASFIYGFDNNE